MGKKTKKLLVVLLTFAMCFGLLPMMSFADDTGSDAGLTITQTIPETAETNSSATASFELKNNDTTEAKTVTINIRFQDTNKNHELVMGNFRDSTGALLSAKRLSEWVVKAGGTAPAAGQWMPGDKFLGYDIGPITIKANNTCKIIADVIASVAGDYEFEAQAESCESNTAVMKVSEHSSTETPVAEIEGNKYLTLYDAFLAAAGRTAKIKMLTDYTMTKPIWTQEDGTSVTLDMNGKTVTANGCKSNTGDDAVDSALFAQRYSKNSLIITGNGTFDLKNNSTNNLVFPHGTVIIENGRFLRGTCEPNEKQEYFVGTINGKGKLIINGGYFDCGYYNSGDIEKTCYRMVNGSWGQYINIQGGTFVGQNPAWGDQGMAHTCENRTNTNYCQTTFLEGQNWEDTEIPYMYTIAEGSRGDGRPTWTVSVKYDITPAPLHDCATENPIPDVELVEGYGVKVDGRNITISADNVRKHTNGAGEEGKWVGFSVRAPEHATGYKMQIGDGNQLSEAMNLEENVDGAGGNGVAFYFDADSLRGNTEQVALQWQYAGDTGQASNGNKNGWTGWCDEYDSTNELWTVRNDPKPGVTNVYTVKMTAAEEPPSGGYGGYTPVITEPVYTVSLPSSPTGGSISSDKSKASEGDTVTITAAPEEGYETEKITVTDKNGNPVEVTSLGDNKYSFKMPKSKAVVNAVFKANEPSGTGILNKTDRYAYIIGHPDGLIYPNNPITRAEAATIFFRLLNDSSRELYKTKENPFTDVDKGDWFNTAVSTMTRAGILKGYPDGTFRPSSPITRAEFSAIASRFADPGYKGECPFKDVPDNHWAKDLITGTAHMGWIKGINSYTFEPERSITRAEAVAVVNRILERASLPEDMLSGMLIWRDNSPGDWYFPDIQTASNSYAYEETDRLVPGTSYCYEKWTEILPVPDWAAYEK